MSEANGLPWSWRGDGTRWFGGRENAFLESRSGEYRAGVYNGAFGVIRRVPTGWTDEMIIWGGSSDSVIDKVPLQDDGNLVAYRVGDGAALAESDTSGRNIIVMENDGNLVVYLNSGQAGWSSRDGTMKHGFWRDVGDAAVSVGTAAWDASKSSLKIVTAPYEAVAAFGGSIISGDNIVDAFKAGGSELQEGVTSFADSPVSTMAIQYVANVPGFGTVAGGALSALVAVAHGETLTDVGLAAIRGALPGQPLSSALFDAGVAVAKGQNIVKAAVAGAVQYGTSYLTTAASSYGAKILGDVTKGVTLPSLTLPDGVSLPVGLKDIVNLGSDAYAQLRAKVPGDATNKSAFDLAIQLSATADPQIVEETHQRLQGMNKQAFELGQALHAGVMVGTVALASGVPQPALSKAVAQVNTKVAMRKAGPVALGVGVIAVGAAFLL